MKLSFVTFAATTSVVSAGYKSIPIAKSGLSATSRLGQRVLSKARRVEEQDGEVDMTWVSAYSLKFQGCHHVQQWNDEVEDDEDVRISTKRLVRFRLCPSDNCSEKSGAGCKGGYGDYIVDLNTFVDAYFEATRQISNYECENYLEYNCDCDDDDGKGDDFDRDICEYDCFAEADLQTCVDRNPYEDDENREEEFEVDRYMECQQWEPAQDENGNNRKLEEGEEEQWFVGPYCAEQGGAVYLGLFTDDACTLFADDNGGRSTYEYLAGDDLPYSSYSIIGPECLSCLDMQEVNNNNNNDNNNNNNGQDMNNMILDSCEEIYTASGKCEEYLPEGMVDEPNNNACNYINGVKVVRKDGIITSLGGRPSGAATFFIVVFALACGVLAFYVYYLRTRLGVKQNTLL